MNVFARAAEARQARRIGSGLRGAGGLALLVALLLGALYSSVLLHLGQQWWDDENYS
jgi:hypothetical protein